MTASVALMSTRDALLWDEVRCLDIAPGDRATPLVLAFDENAEELAFPVIYLGVPHVIKSKVRATTFTMATSEICRQERHGVQPRHIVCMKVLHLRLSQGLTLTFRNTPDGDNITWAMLEDKSFIKKSPDTNLALLKSIPCSVDYWLQKEVFAMM